MQMMTETAAPSRVDPERDTAALRTLKVLGPPPANWVLPTAGLDHDVAIIGAGQTGLGLAFALRRLGVHNVGVFDAATENAAGVWRAPARMNVLRTPKNIVGPELGIAELSFRHWYEARHGQAAYDALAFIARTDWAEYLDWFREITDIQPRYETRLTQIAPREGGFALQLEHRGVPTATTARKIVLATGIVGFGGPYIPDEIAAALPLACYSHTSAPIDFAALAGKSVAVIGGAASAFDAAGTALEQGASDVHLFSRRDAVANHTPGRIRGYPGITNNFHRLNDADRWWFGLILKQLGTTAPPEALKRVAAHSNFALHLGARIANLRVEGGRIHFHDGEDAFRFDHLILGTGYTADPERQPELAPIAPDIARWQDRYEPPAELGDPALGSSPYLGAAYELTERTAGGAPYLKDIHLISAAASLSYGRPVGDIPSMLNSLTAVSNAIVQDLFFADHDAHLHHARKPPEPSAYDGSLYASALWKAQRSAAE
jgi:cation diffusion facilitator CzcD-associated flavoprotein CzcO